MGDVDARDPFPPEIRPRDDAEAEARVREEAVRLLYARSPLAMAGSSACAVGVAWVFKDHAPHGATLAWLSFVLALAIARLREGFLYSRRAEPGASRRWARRFVVGSTLTGVAWGSGALILYPHAPLAHQFFLAFVVGGLCAGAASSDASHPPAFTAFTAPALLPLALLFFAGGDAIHFAMGGMTVLFGVATGLLSRMGGGSVREATRARFGNERLVAELAREKEQLANVIEGSSESAERLRLTQERLVESTRLAALGTLTAGVAHEINNPLSWVHSNVAFVLERLGRDDPQASDADAGELREALRDALHGAERIAAVVRSMRSLGRTKDGVEVREVDVRAEILEALQVVRNQLTQRAVVVYDAEGALPFVRAVPGELSRVFLNILVNASHAIPTGRVPENRITVGARESGEELVVEIADTGKGMTPEVRGRIFEPFFTTKPVGEGTGLGLAIARSIVEGAGGRIEVESEVGRGSVFRIRLPVAWKDQPGSADRADAASGVEPGGETTRLRVLIIDDEPMVAHSLVRDLEASADADVAYSAADALLRIDAGGEWDAVLCDLMMPAMDGIAFHQLLATRHPAWLGRVVFMTGGAFGERAERFVMDPGVVVIAKPAQRAHLIGALEEAARKGRGAGGEDAARAMPA